MAVTTDIPGFKVTPVAMSRVAFRDLRNDSSADGVLARYNHSRSGWCDLVPCNTFKDYPFPHPMPSPVLMANMMHLVAILAAGALVHHFVSSEFVYQMTRFMATGKERHAEF